MSGLLPKIAASNAPNVSRACAPSLAEHPDHASLFADRVAYNARQRNPTTRNLVAARIADHETRAARLEQERERIPPGRIERIEQRQAAEQTERAIDA